MQHDKIMKCIEKLYKYSYKIFNLKNILCMLIGRGDEMIEIRNIMRSVWSTLLQQLNDTI